VGRSNPFDYRPSSASASATRTRTPARPVAGVAPDALRLVSARDRRGL